MCEQEGHIKRDIIISSMIEETPGVEERKSYYETLSVDSSLAVTEGGLILHQLPPSATHPKNT